MVREQTDGDRGRLFAGCNDKGDVLLYYASCYAMDLHQQVFSVLFMGMNLATQINLERNSAEIKWRRRRRFRFRAYLTRGIQVSLWGNFRRLILILTACAIEQVIDRICVLQRCSSDIERYTMTIPSSWIKK
jgi:hypothetical protein